MFHLSLKNGAAFQCVVWIFYAVFQLPTIRSNSNRIDLRQTAPFHLSSGFKVINTVKGITKFIMTLGNCPLFFVSGASQFVAAGSRSFVGAHHSSRVSWFPFVEDGKLHGLPTRTIKTLRAHRMQFICPYPRLDSKNGTPVAQRIKVPVVKGPFPQPCTKAVTSGDFFRNKITGASRQKQYEIFLEFSFAKVDVTRVEEVFDTASKLIK